MPHEKPPGHLPVPSRRETMSPSDRDARITLGGQKPPASRRNPLAAVANGGLTTPQEARPHAEEMTFHSMRRGEVKRTLARPQKVMELIGSAARAGGKKDFGGGVQVIIFQDSKGRNMAKITHTYRNWLGITRRKEIVVDNAGSRIA